MQPERRITIPIAPCVDPGAREVEAELDRIVASTMFQASPTHTAFLSFIVERCLAGDGAHIKAYTIAVDALGRDADFDPQINPIVRVEAGRLRRKLASYYAEEGAADPVIIDLPRGSYVPIFRARAGSALSAGLNNNEHEAPAEARIATVAPARRDKPADAITKTLLQLLELCRIMTAMASQRGGARPANGKRRPVLRAASAGKARPADGGAKAPCRRSARRVGVEPPTASRPSRRRKFTAGPSRM